jgi:hypothetical protein
MCKKLFRKDKDKEVSNLKSEALNLKSCFKGIFDRRSKWAVVFWGMAYRKPLYSL